MILPLHALRIFLPFAFGYGLSYFFRVVNATVAPDLVRDLGLAASDLGLLTSAYLLAFASMQLPLGLLLDRFGARRTEAVLLVFAALGSLVFATADRTFELMIGRALIGFGVSACLMAAFKAFVVWFPSEKLPFVNGCQLAAGGLGALAATTPIEGALHVIDWRGVFVVLALLSLLAATAILLVVPEHNSTPVRESWRRQVRGIGVVFRSQLFWRVAPITVFSQATFLSIQGLWSGPWLRDVAGLDRAQVASHLLLIAAAMVAGFVVLGWTTERLGRWNIRPLTVAVAGMVLFVFAQAVLVAQATHALHFTWAAFGFFGTSGMIPYATLSQRFPARLAGRVNTGLNVMAFAFAFAGQWSIGAVIDRWPLTASGGYDPKAYQVAFALMLGLQLLALAWFLWFRREGIAEARNRE
jgi:predicted MFS family arabinose efflux permease